jgi:hypothetical protein
MGKENWRVILVSETTPEFCPYRFYNWRDKYRGGKAEFLCRLNDGKCSKIKCKKRKKNLGVVS